MNRLRTLLGLLVTTLPGSVSAQDSVVLLPPIGVTATRLPPTTTRAGLALTTLTGDSARGGRSFATLEELLAFVPGVFATDRGDATVDQRITIRGSGARANFGIRGLRLLIDGVPATLPDGQTQLGALIPGTIQRLEVARGPLGALHGNASAGVIAIETQGVPDSTAVRGSLALGVDGWFDQVASLDVVLGRGVGATLSRSEERHDGSRAHASSRETNWTGAVGWRLTPRTTVIVRGAWQVMPFSESPGALTDPEFVADPHQAAGRNVRLDAGKTASQRQLSLGVRHRDGALDAGIHAWVLGRDLANPLAAPAPTTPANGVWIDLERSVSGIRTDLVWRTTGQLTMSGGIDWQQMRDDRRNRAHDGNEPFGAPFVDQQERVSELGPFVQGQFRVSNAVHLGAGIRHDHTTFDVRDALDPARSGTRSMGATTGSTSLGWSSGTWEGWFGVAGGFETPTTTELTNRADHATGLNTTLDPARTTSIEAGVVRAAHRVRLEFAAWTSRTTDAILPAADVDGRSIFHNVDHTTSRGVELTASAAIAPTMVIRGTATYVDARFGTGVRDADGVVIGGNILPGVPRYSGIVGGTWRPGALTLDVDHQLRSDTPADDHGSVIAPGWDQGITNLQLRRTWSRTTLHLTVRNAFDRAVVGAVVVNAAAGRFIQPLPGRRVTLGMDVRI